MTFELSEVQKRIVSHRKGHLRIVACPGSGKTETVSQRVAEMIAEGYDPSTIVAFTFTRKAAENLRFRIRLHLDKKSDRTDFGDMFVGTIDAFCLHLLKALRPEFKSFDILDESRRMAFLDRWYFQIGLSELVERDGTGKWEGLKKFSSSVDIMVNEMVDEDDLSDRDFAECYKRFKEKMQDEKFFDYGSVITTLISTIEENHDVSDDLKSRVKHVVFDEYQDVNMLQERLLEILSSGADSVCVVGDDDQNIFQWRGSNVAHIIEFPKKYNKYGTSTEELGINYRSTSEIIRSARRFIEHNINRVRKNIVADPEQARVFQDGDIFCREFETDIEEFDFIGDEIERLVGSDFIGKGGEEFALSPKDIAILVRTNRDAFRITNFLRQRGISVIADSGGNVFQTPEVLLALDCIFYVFDCQSYSSNNTPTREDLSTMYEEIFGTRNTELFLTEIEKVRNRALKIIAKGERDYLPNLGLQEFFQRILNAMGVESMLFGDDVMFHLGVLSKTVSDYEYVYQSLRARQVPGFKWFVSQFASMQVADPSQQDPTMIDSVRVMTVFKAKGLEFPAVFIPSFVNTGKRPRDRIYVDDDLYDFQRYEGGREDSRRVYYTAVTRSEKYLYLTSAALRNINAQGQNTNTRRFRQNVFVDEMQTDRFSDIPNQSLRHSGLEIRVQDSGIFPTSFTKIEIYNRCPHDYRLRNVFGFNAGVPAAFGYGTNIHNILNKIHSDYIRDKKVPTKKEMDRIFETMFFLRFAPGKQNDIFKAAAKNVVDKYVGVHKGDFDRLLETEKRFEFVYGDSIISGDIDLLKKVNDDGKLTEVEIIDFKTDRQNDDGKYDVDYSDQVRFYAFAASESLGYVPERAVIHHLDSDTKEMVDISIDAQMQTMERFSSRVNRILEGNFTPSPEKSKCSGCDYRAICSFKEFTLGPDFEPTASSKREPVKSSNSNDMQPPVLGKSVVSRKMRADAEKLAAGSVSRNNDGTFSVVSRSDPTKRYLVTSVGCTCDGFRFYPHRNPGTVPTCTHVEAVKIFSANRVR